MSSHIVEIDRYSLASILMILYFDNTKISTATAFFYLHEGAHFLVTNWHNCSGRHPQTGNHLSEKTAAEPNRIEVGLNIASQIGTKANASLSLRDEEGKPLWWVHPELGRNVDIAVLPIADDDRFDFYAVNMLAASPMKISVGMDVYVVGYPLGPGDGFPIWKRASVASEPDLIH